MVEPHPVRVTPALHRAFVNADPQRLAQVWTNLLTNAAKFSPPETPIEVVIRADDTHAFVSVVDRGRGIPSDELPHVFERYYRRDRGTDKRSEGLGLGLYIARGLAEAHGGRITVQSEVGRGSTFTVQLLLREQRARTDEP